MTDLATALATQVLGEFEGSDVLGVGIEIPNAGGGLNEALMVEPLILHKDDECYVLLHCSTRYIKFPPIKDTDCVRRVQVLHAVEGMFVDAEFAKSHLDQVRDQISEAKERAAGIQRLSLDGDPEEADEAEVLVAQHNQGVHADGLRDNCPLCEDERQAVADEAESDGKAKRRGPREAGT